MTTLFRRAAAVTIDSLRVTDLRVQFKIEKSLTRSPNKSEITITNLATATRAKIQTKGAKVILEAGYEGSTEVLFAGTARTIAHVRTGADWETKVQCGDADAALARARIQASFGPNARVSDVLGVAAKQLGVPIGNAIDEFRKGNFRGALDLFENGITLSGNAADELDRLTSAAGLSWSVQDGALQVLRHGSAAPGTAILLDTTSGLIGSPEFGEKGVLKAKSLLQPGLRPGRRVELHSETKTGLFRVQKVVHEGDTAGQSWYSEVELQPL